MRVDPALDRTVSSASSWDKPPTELVTDRGTGAP